MTLEKLTNDICRFAIDNRLVNYAAAGTSLYEINDKTIRDYPLFYVSPTGTHSFDGNIMTYSLSLFYIDRLLDDSSNEYSILSYSIENLRNIINGISDFEGVISVSDNVQFINFTETERLSDRCCGAYATITVQVPANSCYSE